MPPPICSSPGWAVSVSRSWPPPSPGPQLSGLGIAWRTVSKVQILLAVPLLAFCALRTTQIAVLLYGERYAAVGPLLGLFIAFTLAQQLAGGGVHQAALYVLGRQRLALWAQAGALVVTIGLGLLLIRIAGPLGGAAGALIAIGIGQLGAQVFQLVLAWRLLRRPYPSRFALRLGVAIVLPLAVGRALAAPAHFAAAVLPFAHGAALAGRRAPDATRGCREPPRPAAGGLAFALLLVLCLAATRPLDAEDRPLLAGVNPRLARLLAPFVSTVFRWPPRARLRAPPRRRSG